MLKIYDLAEYRTEDEIDRFIEHCKSIPIDDSPRGYNLNTVVEDDYRAGSFYLAEDDSCVWWFGPRNRRGIASSDDYKWFCFRTEDGVFHKFDMTDIARSREAMNKILEWIARGSATDGPILNLAQDEVEFMDI
jgi:hypothetical protein